MSTPIHHITFESKYSIGYLSIGIAMSMITPISYSVYLYYSEDNACSNFILANCFFLGLIFMTFYTGINDIKKIIIHDKGIEIDYLFIKSNKWIDKSKIKGFALYRFRHGDGIELILEDKKSVTLSGAICRNLDELKRELEKRGIKKLKLISKHSTNILLNRV